MTPRANFLLALAACAMAAGQAQAQELAVSRLQHYTDHRGWNEAGLGPVHQVVLAATVTPSGFPTLVFAEANGMREPLTHFPQPGAPDVYAHWRRYEPGPAGAWRIVAERGDAKATPVSTPALKAPQKVPLIDKVHVTGPAGVLTPGERYIFQVMLEDLEDGVLENRSLSFSDPYTASR